MTVFKGFMLMVKRNMGIILMYFCIFIGITVAMNNVDRGSNAGDFSAEKRDIAVVDADKTELSEALTAYLKRNHHVTIEKDDKAKLAEELYYGKSDIVVRMEKGFAQKALEGKAAVKLTQAPGSYDGIYLKQQVNQFIGDVLSYHSLGYSVSESSRKIAEQKQCKVNMEDINGNGGKAPGYGYFFQYFPYLFIAALGVALGKILVTFRKKTVKNRMMTSPVSLLRQNAEIILAFLVMGTILYVICMLVAIGLYGESMLKASNFGYYVLNGYIDLLAALEVAFLIGLVVKKERAVDMFITPISLGISFLCGVFVPLSLLAAPVKKVAAFLPVYWYEKVNNLLMEHAEISGEIGTQVWQGIGIQILFLFALAGIGMAIAKYQQQER